MSTPFALAIIALRALTEIEHTWTQMSHTGLLVHKTFHNIKIWIDAIKNNSWRVTKQEVWDAAALIIFHQCLAQACNSLYLKTVQQKWGILGLNLKDSFNTSPLSWLSRAAQKH